MSVRFTVITVCYNAEKVIRETIKSVLTQTFTDFEFIIVDGKSEDGTVRIIRDYENDYRIQWYSEPDSGIYNAMNKGIGYAKGDYIFFLNAGDEFHSDDVLEKVNGIIDISYTDIIIGNVGFKTKDGLKIKQYNVGIKLLELLQNGDSVCHQAVFASKSCLVNGFDEKFKICADYDWLCSQINAGKTVTKAELVIVNYDVYGISNQIQYQKLHWEECIEILKRRFPELGMKEKVYSYRLSIQSKKNRILYELMNQWLILKQRGKKIDDYFWHFGIQTIAIYGMHYLGQRLYDELKDGSVEVKYGIDKSEKIYNKVPIICPDELFEQVDAIVITPVFDYLEIRQELQKKICCTMISIEEILYFKDFDEYERKSEL